MFVDCNHATYIASAWVTKVNGMFACRVPFALLQCHDDIESTCAGRTCNHTCYEASQKSRNHFRTQISGKYWLTLSVHCQFLLNCPTSYKIANLHSQEVLENDQWVLSSDRCQEHGPVGPAIEGGEQLWRVVFEGCKARCPNRAIAGRKQGSILFPQ